MSSKGEKANTEFLRKVLQLDKVELTGEIVWQMEEYSSERITEPLLAVSSGTSALVAGAEKTYLAVKEYLKDRNIAAGTIRSGSLGISNFEPLLSVQLPGRTRICFSKITAEKITPLLDDVFHHTIPEENVLGQFRNARHDAWKDVPFLDELPFFSHQQRVILKNCGFSDPLNVAEYIAGGGYRSFIKAIHKYTYEDVCDIVEKSGLRGRSGSGYLTGKKWRTAFQTSADEKYLICNAEESDPGAFMDRAIMEGNPHLLLEGMAIAAYGIGAAKAFIYIRTEYSQAIASLEEAIRSAYLLGILGHDIFGSGFNLDIIIRKGPGAFVCGEETALINSLEGKRGMPQTKPPFPATSGFHRKPTVINNVETLSNIPVIIEKGPEWYRSTGIKNNSGTKILALSGKTKMTGFIEVPLGTSLRRIIFDIAEGIADDKKFKALHIGGPSGCIIPEEKLDVPLSFDDLASAGTVMGSGGMVVMDEDTCIVDMAKYYMDFMQKQSCGKCIPCREGTRRMSEILESITKKPADEFGHTTLERFKGVMQLESLATVMKDTSLCGLGRSAPNPVISSLKHFRNEFEEHIFDRNCRSNTCTELRTYYISVEMCTGCSICAKKCPADAIIGTPRHPYFIAEDKCTNCGICFGVCKFNAVFYK